MGGVGDKVALGVEGRLEAGEQVIESAAEIGQLIGRLTEVKALVKVPGGDDLGGAGDRSQGAQKATGDQPAEPDRDGDQDRERNARPDEELCGAIPWAELAGVVRAEEPAGVVDLVPRSRALTMASTTIPAAMMPAV
jgi:hypothetical protein